jgi:Protein of unknown function (DUF2815)
MPSAQNAKGSKTKEAGLTVITPPALAVYAYVWKPRPAMTEGREMQYSIVLIFKAGTNLDLLKAAARKAVERKWGGKAPSNLKSPFRKGDEARPDDPLFKGCTFITARTTQKPGIVDRNVQPILDEMDFYSGCQCKASVYASAYDQKGNKGVTFLLNNIQKLADGTRLSGRKPAEEEFESEEGGDGGDDGEELDDDIPF